MACSGVRQTAGYAECIISSKEVSFYVTIEVVEEEIQYVLFYV